MFSYRMHPEKNYQYELKENIMKNKLKMIYERISEDNVIILNMIKELEVDAELLLEFIKIIRGTLEFPKDKPKDKNEIKVFKLLNTMENILT